MRRGYGDGCASKQRRSLTRRQKVEDDDAPVDKGKGKGKAPAPEDAEEEEDDDDDDDEDSDDELIVRGPRKRKQVDYTSVSACVEWVGWGWIASWGGRELWGK